MKGNCTSPKNTRVNLKSLMVEGSLFLIHWNLSTSSGLTRICRKAFWMSAAKAIGFRLFLTRKVHNKFFKGVPVFEHSFHDGPPSLGLAEVSKTILSFVVATDSHTTGLCGCRSFVPLVLPPPIQLPLRQAVIESPDHTCQSCWALPLIFSPGLPISLCFHVRWLVEGDDLVSTPNWLNTNFLTLV